jgi:hypothetical protein
VTKLYCGSKVILTATVTSWALDLKNVLLMPGIACCVLGLAATCWLLTVLLQWNMLVYPKLRVMHQHSFAAVDIRRMFHLHYGAPNSLISGLCLCCLDGFIN